MVTEKFEPSAVIESDSLVERKRELGQRKQDLDNKKLVIRKIEGLPQSVENLIAVRKEFFTKRKSLEEKVGALFEDGNIYSEYSGRVGVGFMGRHHKAAEHFLKSLDEAAYNFVANRKQGLGDYLLHNEITDSIRKALELLGAKVSMSGNNISFIVAGNLSGDNREVFNKLRSGLQVPDLEGVLDYYRAINNFYENILTVIQEKRLPQEEEIASFSPQEKIMISDDYLDGQGQWLVQDGRQKLGEVNIALGNEEHEFTKDSRALELEEEQQKRRKGV
ncbi:MAG: hypothetical protein PHN39_02015 [Candidatus Pacebacteria bacterium]|nr:hypothetical protein [Candidatus Paceibacterota bacterium]